MLLLSLFLLIGLILATSFLCSLTEAVLLSLNPLQLKLEKSRGEKRAGKWLSLKQRIERPIAAILVFNTAANTGLATLAGAVFIQGFGAEWLWLFSLILSIAILFGGEMAPKIIGVHHAARFARPLLRPLQVMLWIAHPLVSAMEGFCERLKSKPQSKASSSDQIMDIITLVQAAKAEQAIHNREEIIIIHAATLSARRVRAVMVPATGVKVFDARLSLLENVLQAGDKLHRSYPVSFDGTLEKVHGYIRVRELFVDNLLTDGQADWLNRVRPVLRMDGESSLTHLLAEFLENREIAALVHSRDETHVGWVTLDDVTETLMGAR
ncbi:MAG: CNNM domain-containing protein [Verrucomicrobiota bacterium]